MVVPSQQNCNQSQKQLVISGSRQASVAVKGCAFELWLMSNKLQLLGNAKAFFVATDANAPRRR